MTRRAEVDTRCAQKVMVSKRRSVVHRSHPGSSAHPGLTAETVVFPHMVFLLVVFSRMGFSHMVFLRMVFLHMVFSQMYIDTAGYAQARLHVTHVHMHALFVTRFYS